MDPATVAGLGLAVAPLIISALENYEYTFQPIIIFSRRYRREVERFQHALKVQKVDFANECCFLLHSVTSNRGNVMVNDRHHALWQDRDLEDRLRILLADCYDACVSALSLINAVLSEILRETKTLDILTQKRTGRIDVDWLKSLRQRSKISFSKDRYDDKLKELESRIESLHRIRKHVEHIEDTRRAPEASSSERVDYFRIVQSASSRLHDALESHWRCESSEVHFANICLDAPKEESQDIHFDLAWSCPGRARVSSQKADPIRLSIEAFSESQKLHKDGSQFSGQKQTLESALEKAIGSAKLSAKSTALLRPSQSSNVEAVAVSASVPDLYSIPDLCYHLTCQPTAPALRHCIGFLQKTKTFKHVVYAPTDDVPSMAPTRTLKDALQAIKESSEGIPLPEKLGLAKLLALAVLRFHSTPWLNPQWESQDVVFHSIWDSPLESLRTPFLKSSVLTRAYATSQPTVQHGHALDRRTVAQGKKPIRSHIRNQTLYNLGVMLIELAYDSPFNDLQTPDDDQGDSFTPYWAAERLGESVRKVLGQRYAEAVKICLHCGFGPSDDLADLDLQRDFFSKVVQKLEKCADAVSI